MSDPRAAQPSIPLRIAYAGALVALVAMGYGGVATSFFLADDFNVLGIVSHAKTFWDGTAIESGWEYFRPLTALSFWWNYLACGWDSATGYHLVALTFHWCNACLVARLTLRVFDEPIGAAFAGAWFAVLPAHPECITWIASRADVLCATGTLLCVTGWLSFLRGGGRGWALFEAGLGFVFALLTKDSAMILPAVLVAMALIYRDRSIRQRLRSLLAFAALSILYVIARVNVLGGFGGQQSGGSSAHLVIDLGRAVRFTIDAMHAMLMPGDSAILGSQCLVLVLCLGLVRFVLVRNRAAVRFVTLSWPLFLVFLILLAPAANSVVMDLSNGTNTRFLYMPSAFFCVGLGVLLGTALDAARQTQRRPTALITAGAALLATYAFAIHQDNRKWAEAGSITRTIVTQLREFNVDHDYKWVFIYQLPDNHDGAYVFRNGIDTAIENLVSKTMLFPSYGRLEKADWDKYAALRRADPSAYPGVLMLRWDARKGRLIGP